MPKNDSTSLFEVECAQIDCRKRKRKTKGCLEYELFETENNYKLYKELSTQNYEIQPSDAFIVKYPCCREVFAGQYRDRVVHHLIIGRKSSQFESLFIDASYSCRKGKGTLYGIKDAYSQVQKCTNNFKNAVYIVKGDLSSCFMRVAKPILMDMLQPIINDDWENWLFGKIIFNKPQDYCILKSHPSDWDGLPKHKSLFGTDGMPIGNLTSQILVNFYLTPFDNWAISYTNVLGYGRYVDDFFAIFSSYGDAQQFIIDCQFELEKYNMQLHPHKIQIINSNYGFEFIGAYIKPHRIYSTKRTVNKFSETLFKSYNNGIACWFGSINSYLGYLAQFKSYRIRYKIIRHFDYLHNWGYFNDDLTKFIPYKDFQHLVNVHKSKYTKFEWLMLGHYSTWRSKTIIRLNKTD